MAGVPLRETICTYFALNRKRRKKSSLLINSQILTLRNKDNRLFRNFVLTLYLFGDKQNYQCILRLALRKSDGYSVAFTSATRIVLFSNNTSPYTMSIRTGAQNFPFCKHKLCMYIYEGN